MSKEKKFRSYYSLVRQKQADDTRARIAVAARHLLGQKGGGAVTMEAIAREAGVATPTVYAVFGSKRRILFELIDRARFGPAYEDLLSQVQQKENPVERLLMAPRIARRIYDAERSEIEFLLKAGVPYTELTAIEKEKEAGRYEAQGETIARLHQSKRLRPGLPETEARDILWTLTGRDLYRMLVVERQWSANQYEKWLSATLLSALVQPE